MRTKAKWNVEGERSSKYFCNLEKRYFTEKAIPKLILDNGIEITNQGDILTQQKIFYEALYTSKGTVVSDNHFIFFYENNPFIKKLNLEESEVDYKICASAIALRFIKVLTYLISDTQMGFMKGRFIGECTRLICDIIEKCDENNIPGVLILLDFEKSLRFSRVELYSQIFRIFGVWSFNNSLLRNILS